MDHLELPEVCNTDGIVLWTHIQYVWNTIIVKVIFARVSSSIACSNKSEINRLNLAQSSFSCYKPYFPKCGELLLVHWEGERKKVNLCQVSRGKTTFFKLIFRTIWDLKSFSSFTGQEIKRCQHLIHHMKCCHNHFSRTSNNSIKPWLPGSEKMCFWCISLSLWSVFS